MNPPIFPREAKRFYSRGDYYLGRNPIFNPFLLLEHLTASQKLYKRHPLLNYGMSDSVNAPSENQLMTPEDRFASQVQLLLHTVHQLGSIEGGHILEVGSGTGSGAYIVNNVFSPASINGVDFAPSQVARAKRINKQNHHIHFHRLSASDIASHFGDEQFDGIYSVEMVQHLDQKTLQRFFEGAFTALKSEKKLSFCSFFSQNTEGQAELRKVFPTVDLGLDFMHNIEDIKQMLEQIGFKDIQTNSIGEYVWDQLIRWCNQIAPEQTWSNAYLKVFPGLLDYYNVTGTKR